MKDYIEHYSIDNEKMDYSKESYFFKNIDKYRFRLIIRQINAYRDKKILDIGSGSGKMIDSDNGNFFSLDISQINNSSLSVKTEGDANRIPFKSSSFSAVIMSEVLEHISEPHLALREAHRVLDDKGILVLTVPYREKIKEHLCIHCNKLTPENAHLHSFDEENLFKVLSDSGFDPIRTVKFENRFLYMTHFFSVFSKFPIDFINFIDIIVGNWYNKYNKIMLVSQKRASGSVGRAHPSQG